MAFKDFGRGGYEKRFCEINLNADTWLLRRCGLKKIICFPLAATFISGVVQFVYGTFGKHPC